MKIAGTKLLKKFVPRGPQAWTVSSVSHLSEFFANLVAWSISLLWSLAAAAVSARLFHWKRQAKQIPRKKKDFSVGRTCSLLQCFPHAVGRKCFACHAHFLAYNSLGFSFHKKCDEVRCNKVWQLLKNFRPNEGGPALSLRDALVEVWASRIQTYRTVLTSLPVNPRKLTKRYHPFCICFLHLF